MAAPEAHRDDRADPLFDDGFMETLGYLHIIARRVLSGQMKAERRSRRKGVSVEFADYRQYAPGDDFRFIDWNAYVRTDNLFLKLFEEEEDLQLYLLLDCSASMGFGRPYKFHYARRLAAAVGYLGLAGLDRVHVVPFVDAPPLQATGMLQVRGKAKVFRLMRFLERLRPGGRTDLRHALQTFAAQRRRRGMAIVISDLYDYSGVAAAVNALRFRKFDPYLIHVVSPEEADPSLLGDLRLLDGETDRSRDVTVTEPMLRRYRARFEAYCAGVEAFCSGRGVGYTRCRTDVPFRDAVVAMLRRGRLLQ